MIDLTTFSDPDPASSSSSSSTLLSASDVSDLSDAASAALLDSQTEQHLFDLISCLESSVGADRESITLHPVHPPTLGQGSVAGSSVDAAATMTSGLDSDCSSVKSLSSLLSSGTETDNRTDLSTQDHLMADIYRTISGASLSIGIPHGAAKRNFPEDPASLPAAKITRYDIERLFSDDDDDDEDDEVENGVPYSEVLAASCDQMSLPSTESSERTAGVGLPRDPKVESLLNKVREMLSSTDTDDSSDEDSSRHGDSWLSVVPRKVAATEPAVEQEDRGLIICEDVKDEELVDSYLCSDCQPCKLLKGPQGIESVAEGSQQQLAPFSKSNPYWFMRGCDNGLDDSQGVFVSDKKKHLAKVLTVLWIRNYLFRIRIQL